jgi:glutathione S-transferase
MLKIYGSKGSGHANKVEYTAILLGLGYEYQEVDFQKDLKTDWYLKLHPAGKIPVIDDDGFVLFESNSICRYLAGKKESDLFPKDLKERALVDQWMDFSEMHVGDAMGKVAFVKLFGPRMGIPHDEKMLESGMKDLDRFLPIVDKQLGQHKFLAGDKMTLADISLLTTLEYGDSFKHDFSKYKNLSAWKKKIQAMDFKKKAAKK